MAFNALVDLGTVGEDITDSTVSISGCTGSSCGSGCTSLATSQAVSGFPKTLTGIADNVVSLFVKVDNGLCSGTTQCIDITFVAEATPTPTPTATPIVPTPTPTPTATPIVPTPTDTPIVPTPTDTPIVPTPTDTPIVPTPTPTPTDTSVSCVDSVSFDVDSAGEVRYVTCEGVTVYETYGIGPQVINDCIENNSLFALSATISFVSYGSPCVVPTPVPTPTPTQVTVYAYYRAQEVLETNISTTYCNNFGSGGEGYTINSPFYTTDSILTPGTTTIYSDYGLTTPVVGSWSESNITRMAYITESENQSAQNTPTTTNPNGDLLYDGGTYKFMRVNSNGGIISLGNDSCGGGGGEA